MFKKSVTYSFLLLLFSALLFTSCTRDEGVIDNAISPEGAFSCPELPGSDVEILSTEALLDKIQESTINYFWEHAEPKSGMARERYTSGNIVTSGGTGFGIMALIAGAERGFIEKDTLLSRLLHTCRFLLNADRFHGAWSHWMDGATGKAIAFSTRDDGGDLVETGFLVQGLLTARAYFSGLNQVEDSLRNLVDTLWHGVEWDWYTRGENVLYWHWSPNYGFAMNMPIRGWNEALITYIIAASSPTYPIEKEVYHEGWAANMTNGKRFYELELPLGPDFGGPLFFAHYSFLGLDPRGLSDRYADYWEQNKNHSLINYQYCVSNPYQFCYYSDSCWGLTAGDDPLKGYQSHAPFNTWGRDNGTITPSAALSSMPYTPAESMKALAYFYYKTGDKLFGKYGFHDGFNPGLNWYANSYIAIDQGPIAVMIENYRSGLLWKVFMKNKAIQNGLKNLEFTIKHE